MTTNVPSEIVSLSVNDLIPYDSNPKIHSEDQIQQLADSIREWGWTVPILIDENQTVLAGHGRLYAAKKLGMDNVPCVIANNWSEDQKKAYIIADNRLAQNGSWDHKLLNEQLAQLSESFDINLAGFSNTDIDLLQATVNDVEFELPAVLNEEIDPEINSINPTKTTDGYVEFSVVITAEEKTRLIETLNQISKNHGISGHGACLVAMCEMI
tara:strand:+ start:303 stop:938 length:636 start_codon:yes stop_codon:yes gene_type:complete